ncbi:ABC transporter permease [Chondromyces apiculatus]|uniref:Oligopeptide transport system permease protein OppB n=1 Tax=Chondromyces apiculatus DSM 436 TaxID=1192034 RepID=A0A017SYZ6_9BACT|nr:ABC transporter permease subunit [Chondromyces apiculatus]EYF01511.1 Oligopeptide transport system permease protein OppB [Chondromyces apiculatus DSM 436]
MIRFVLKRLLSILPTLLIVATVAFVMMRFVPGGPFDQERAVPAEVERALRAKYHLDDPLAKQYGDWLWALVSRGDLGPAFKYPNRTVNEIIALSLPISMQLGVLAMIFALLVGVPLGIVGAVRQNTWKDTAAMATAMVGVSIPRFVLAPLMILIFSLTLFWFPVARWETWRHMVLPVVCAGLPMAAYLARLTRGGMLEVIRSDFVRTARAKGLSERRVILRHALRGGMLPVVSYLGPGFSHLLVGSLVVEKIFNIPGMGRYFVEAAMNRDYNLVLGVMLVYGVLLMVFNALVDVAYAFIDPRVELG